MKLLPRGVCLSILPLLCMAAASACGEPKLLLAQAQIQIPSDAQLDRMERQGIVTPPLYDGRGGTDGGIAAETARWRIKPTASTRNCSAAAFALIVSCSRTAGQLPNFRIAKRSSTPSAAASGTATSKPRSRTTTRRRTGQTSARPD